MRIARRALPGRLRRAARSGVVAAWDRVHPPTLAQRFARLERASGGRLQIAATNVMDGRSVAFRADEPAPLASTAKLALALEVLARVDDGRTGLGTRVTVEAGDAVLGDGRLDLLLRDAPHQPVTCTVAELLHLALVESDNTATDRLFRLVGGPAAVQQRVERIGVRGLRVDRTIGQLLETRRRLIADAGGDRVAASRIFLQDLRDTTTPAAMRQLLVAIHHGGGLTPASAAHLRSLMRACTTSATRIRAGAPPGADVAHKTGTLQRDVTADVGLVTLAAGSTIALAVYLRGSLAAGVDRDRAIAGAARLCVTTLA